MAEYTRRDVHTRRVEYRDLRELADKATEPIPDSRIDMEAT